MPVDELTVALGFTVGVALNRGGTCAVASARALVRARDSVPLLGVLAAGTSAGMIVLPLASVLGSAARLPQSVPIGPALVVGGALLGVGAVVNGACLLGSLARLGDGELRFAVLPVGLATGSDLADALGATMHSATRAVDDSGTAMTVLPVASGLLLLALLAALSRFAPHRRLREIVGASILLGVAGAALYLLRPGWSYADLVHQRFGATMQLAGAPATAAALATVAGAAASAATRGRFRPVWRPFAGILRSIAGGFLMAFGAVLVPGGNDALLLAGIPAGVPSAVLAYVVMTGVIAASFLLVRPLPAQKPGAGERTQRGAEGDPGRVPDEHERW